MKKNKTASQQTDLVYQHEFFNTTSATDFILNETGSPPKGYPKKWTGDSYSKTPFASKYSDRRNAFFKHCVSNPGKENIKGYYYELMRLHDGKGPVHEGLIRGAIRYIGQRFDCADFVMLGIVRLLYQFPDSKLLDKKIYNEAKDTILNFKYWPDEPGLDSMCTWTENHQIMFAANEYLAGQLYPDFVFNNSGMTGHEKMQVARKRILQWLELRYKTGFSEWLSHIYYDEDLTALINLVDFCSDPIIVRRAEIVLDLMFLDMALNSNYGVFGSTHGRSYTVEKQNALLESTTDISKLIFGMGTFSGADNMSAVSFALSDTYKLPGVVYEIAKNTTDEFILNRQRMSININEAEKWNLDPNDPDDTMVLLSLEAYAHPRTFKQVINLFDRFKWWENQFFSAFKNNRILIKLLIVTGLWRIAVKYFEKDMTRNTREEVNIYTYKTSDYMLSSAQDYRKGYGGDQQHVWQATLSPKAVCFTTHPGQEGDDSPGYWVGSGTLPRVGQVKNVVIAVYNVSKKRGIYFTNKLFFTHAWFPKGEFDEIVEEKEWIFGRKGDGYIALYSRNSYRWQTEGKDAENEVIAHGIKNIWICETGRKRDNGSFLEFIAGIASADMHFKGNSVVYSSPSVGNVRYGWKGKLLNNGKRVPQRDYMRYDNPYIRAPFPPRDINVTFGKFALTLNLEKGVRKISYYSM